MVLPVRCGKPALRIQLHRLYSFEKSLPGQCVLGSQEVRHLCHRQFKCMLLTRSQGTALASTWLPCRIALWNWKLFFNKIRQLPKTSSSPRKEMYPPKGVMDLRLCHPQHRYRTRYSLQIP